MRVSLQQINNTLIIEIINLFLSRARRVNKPFKNILKKRRRPITPPLLNTTELYRP